MTRLRAFGMLATWSFCAIVSMLAVGTGASAQTVTTLGTKSIVVRDAPDGTVAVKIDSAHLDLTLTVEAGTAAPVTTATVDIDRLRIPGTTTSAAVSLLLDGLPFDQNTSSLEVRAGTRRELTVRSDLPQPGTYRGAAVFVIDGKRSTTQLEVEFQRPTITIDEAKDGILAISVEAGALVLPVKVTTTATVDQPDVALEVSRLTIAGTTVSAEVNAEVDGSTIDTANPTIVVRAGTGRTLNLSAALPRPGVYDGAIVLRQGANRYRTALKVTYGDPPVPTVTADPVGVVRGKTFDVTVRETGHRPVVLDLPTLVNLRKIHTAEVEEAVVPKSVRIQIVENKGLKETADQVLMAPDSQLTFRVSVDGIDDPGSYKAEVRFTVGGAQRGITAPITLLRRKSFGVAFGVLLLGVFIAEVVRRLVLVSRPRLASQMTIARWTEQFRWVLEGLPADERAQPAVAAAAEAIQREMAELAARANAGDLTEADAASQTSTFAARLEFFPRWSAAVTDAAQAGVLADADDDVVKTRHYVAFGAGDAGDAGTALEKILSRTRQGLSAGMVTGLVGHLLERKGQVPKALEARRAEAETQARKAQTDLAAGKFIDARNAYNEARQLWANGLCEVARDTIRASPPVGHSDNQWDDLRKTTNAALQNTVDPGEVEGALQPMFVNYGRRVAQEVDKEYPKGDIAPGKLSGLPLEKVTDAKAKKQALDDAVVELWAAVEESDGTETLLRAEAALDKRKDLIEALKQSTTVQSMGGGDTADAQAQPPGPGLEIASGLSQLGPQALRQVVAQSFTAPDFATVKKRLTRLDWVVAGIAALITIAMGLLLIYGSSMSWGSDNDMLTLFLWGLGVHQATGVTGSIAVRKSVRGGLEGA